MRRVYSVQLHGIASPHVTLKKNSLEGSGQRCLKPLAVWQLLPVPLTNMRERVFIFERFAPLKVSLKLILITRWKPAIPSCQPSHLLENSIHRLFLQPNPCCQEQLIASGGRDKKQETNASLQNSGRIRKIHDRGDATSKDFCGSDISKSYLP